MTQENYGYIIDVIADLQKRLASETASNKYLRGELATKEMIIEKQREILEQCDINTEKLNAKIAELETQIEFMKTENFDAQTLIGGLELKIAEIEIAYDQLKEGIRNGK